MALVALIFLAFRGDEVLAGLNRGSRSAGGALSGLTVLDLRGDDVFVGWNRESRAAGGGTPALGNVNATPFGLRDEPRVIGLGIRMPGSEDVTR